MAALRYVIACAAALGCALLAGGGSARAQPVSESEIKASYLFNFARFTEWPASAFAAPGAPLTLCVAGADPLAGALAGIDRKSVERRELQVRLNVTAAQARGCHLLFVPEAEAAQLGALSRALAGAPVLLIGDGAGRIDDGVMIELRPQGRRLAFAVNLAAARQANLKLSSQMLKLALEVRE